jgi:hypothetical protein
MWKNLNVIQQCMNSRAQAHCMLEQVEKECESHREIRIFLAKEMLTSRRSWKTRSKSVHPCVKHANKLLLQNLTKSEDEQNAFEAVGNIGAVVGLFLSIADCQPNLFYLKDNNNTSCTPFYQQMLLEGKCSIRSVHVTVCSTLQMGWL